jgi:hypothetical protein
MDTNPETVGSAAGADEAVEAQLEYADASAPTGRKKRKDPPRADAIPDFAAVQVADYVRDAAKRIDRLADDLRDKSAGELLSSATQYGRTHPLMMLAGAAVAGFALSRVIKAGVANPITHQETSSKNAYGDNTHVDLNTGIEPLRDLE